MFVIQEALTETATAGEKAQQAISEMFIAVWERLPYVAVGLIVLALFALGGSVIRRLARGSITKAGYDPMIASLISRLVFYITVIAGFFVGAVVVFPDLSPGDLFTGLGIGSVALGFAFKDVLQNLFAGFLILLYRPFRIGDQIRVNDFEGTVEEISVRATKIKTYGSERVVLPNSDLYMNAVLVRTAFEKRRTALSIGIGYGDDPEAARKVLLNALADTKEVLREPGPSVSFTDFGDSSVNLKVFYWTASDQSAASGATDKVLVSVKKALDDARIELPFPQRVVELKNESAAGG